MLKMGLGLTQPKSYSRVEVYPQPYKWPISLIPKQCGTSNKKRVEVEPKGASPHQDLITCLLSTRKDNEEVLTEDEIVHNVMLIMVAGHDTSSVLMTFIIRLLANEPSVYAVVLQGIHKTLSLNAMMTV
jgi:hypothetical protein